MNEYSSESKQFDIAILGTGFSGTILGTVLAKHGVRVLLIDAETHPRFALGESTVPQTTTMMQIIADRFAVTEIKDCCSLKNIQRKVTSQCGIKRNFGFMYHHKGQKQNPKEVTMSVIPHGECHLFRQDIDAYLLTVAIRYGAVVRQKTCIEDIHINEQGVLLQGARGERFSARYVVDATGFRSILAHKLNLRETPTRLKTHSRSLFTHMIGVKPYDDCIQPRKVHKMPRPWFQGTLHHIFDGGWLWIIPFNNHKESTNPLCSVGLNLDLRRFPKTDISPQQEFETFLSKFPSVAKQFETAKPVRDWISTGRLQYSSKRCVGDRFCLLGQASGSVDALFSRGLANTTEAINVLADLLLKAVEDDNFSAQRFEYVERLQQRLLDYNDRLINCSYIAFSNFDLWNAWYRVWLIGATLGTLRLKKAHTKYLKTGNQSFLSALDDPAYLGSLCPELEGYETLFNAAASEVEAVEEGRVSASDAAGRILTLLDQADFVPPNFNAGSASQRYTKYDFGEILQLLAWSKLSAPPELKELCF
ncbi:tryptophan 7-halogenase [Nostoc cf. edaphicum LEGE 07299]|uniref:Tryptophan 7-halogenase n=1 Tax=Nostoc cf. edaphicum LEGE 07299 TaxID=2777974 RepID=A0ABR9TVR4_9NOSO|nr:tryptophan 7-halogenase [Nostoc edaphicum]MBE9104444.1 tryptophan 7-halogenase [Nostoc cf. edaphicum LEGE 07299]